MNKSKELSPWEKLIIKRIRSLIDIRCEGSQKKFVDKTGLNKGSVSQYVNGKNVPSWDNAEKIALYQEKNSQLEFLSIGIQNYSAFQESLINENMYDPEGTYNAYVEFFGQEKGEAEFCEMLKYAYSNTLDSGFDSINNPIENIYFNDNGELVFKMKNHA